MIRTMGVWSVGILLAVGLMGCEGISVGGDTSSEVTETSEVEEQAAVQSNSGANSDTAARWKTYTNDTVGYSVKYPSNWKIDESGGKSNVIVRSSKVSSFGQVTIGVEEKSWNELREGFIKDFQAEELQTTFAGKGAYRFDFPNDTGSDTLAASKVYIPIGDTATYVIVGSFEPEITQQVVATISFK